MKPEIQEEIVLTKPVIGTEMEWNTYIEGQEDNDSVGVRQKNYHLESLKNQILSNYMPGFHKVSGFMSNGGRCYVDNSYTHFETCTPEDTSIRGTVANEIAAEQVLKDCLTLAQESGMIRSFKMYKRVVGTSKIGWGYHENYLFRSPYYVFSGDMRKDNMFHENVINTLRMHLATRNIFAGSGCLMDEIHLGGDGHRMRFFVAQKALVLNTEQDAGTIGKKPLINLRDEPHAKGYGRMHITSGDANMLPQATALKLGTTSIVLRLIEAQWSLKHLQFEPKTTLHVAKQVAGDLTLKQTVRLADGRSIRPIDVQWALLEAATQLDYQVGLSEEEAEILQDWELVLTDLEANNWAKLVDRVDWVARYMFLQAYLDKKNIGWDDPRSIGLDLLWDSIDEQTSGGLRWRNQCLEEDIAMRALIETRKSHPPESTRAYVRGGLIGYAKHRANLNSVIWDKVHVNLGGDSDGEMNQTYMIDLSNPYLSSEKKEYWDGFFQDMHKTNPNPSRWLGKNPVVVP